MSTSHVSHFTVYYFTSIVPRFGQATICVLGPFSPFANNLARTSN